jgi:DNA-binding IscR family transcriptional regulator
MIRLSKLTDYAVVILSLMAKDNTKVRAAMEIASATGIALPTVCQGRL